MHNNELVDTAAGRWKDLGDGGGIVPTDSDDEEDQGDGPSDSSSILSDTYSAISSDLQDDGYSQPEASDKGDEGWLQKKANGITPNGITKDLMRKTTRLVGHYRLARGGTNRSDGTHGFTAVI